MTSFMDALETMQDERYKSKALIKENILSSREYIKVKELFDRRYDIDRALELLDAKIETHNMRRMFSSTYELRAKINSTMAEEIGGLIKLLESFR